ncbi:hypothetical protein VTJ83DRAFT_7240 [Remersonia thermophila]|uniref:OTU domain-containing protein n=1 Tax=Remersonia thermophila TaxID=72144 RepID=A0ABR4D2Y7_9PEZI
MTASTAGSDPPVDGGETLEQMQARHRKEQRDLQGRITNKKKNATKKTRKFVNDECAELERQLKERQEEELRRLLGGGGEGEEEEEEEEENGVDGVDGDGQSRQGPQPSSQVDGLAATLNGTHLSSSSGNASASPSQPGPKQKRNRQKERLARRAAEQLALAEAAANEAANMTDHRAVEREAMQREFAQHKLKEVEIAPDGHCLFAAVADQLVRLGIPVSGGAREGGEEQARPVPGYKAVRKAAADYILGHADDYAGFLAAEEGGDGGVEAYAARIRDTAEWGGQLELSALANAYGVEVRVVQGAGRVEVIRPSTAADGEGEGKERKTVWLAYYRHGYGLGEHYNSLRAETDG